MRKITTTLVLMVLVFTLTGCGNSLVKKSIEQAKTAIESKDYDKALVSLELALDEDKQNKEATKLYEIVDGYQKAKKSIEENNFDEAKKILDTIDEDYISYAIKEDIDVLKGQVDTYSKENENIISVLAEGEALYNNKQYTECKVLLINNILGSNADEIIEPNKYATEEQKAKALDLINKSDQSIIEIQKQKEEEEARIAEEQRKEEEKKKQEQVNNFTPEQAISYVINIYGQAEAGHEYRVGYDGMKNNGKNYYEVYYGVIGGPLSPGADYYGYNVFEDGTVVKFLDNLN